MAKIDLKKELKHLYTASAKEVVVVDVPEMSFAMIDGAGDPNSSQDFQDALNTLYGLSFTLKFMLKKGKDAIDYVVMPLEGLWWAHDMAEFPLDDKDKWRWTAMIMQPDWVTGMLFEEAREQLRKKNPPALDRVRFESFHEGLSAQVMHIGPYSAEGPTIRKLHAFIRDQGRRPRGKHHEIYFGDPRRSAPEKLKTILRQPME